MWILSIVNRVRALAAVARLAKWLQVSNHIAATNRLACQGDVHGDGLSRDHKRVRS